MQRLRPDAIFRRHKMRFGAELRPNSTRFKIWAPKCKTMQLKLKGRRSPIDMKAMDDGWFRLDAEGVGAGTLYKYVLPDGSAIPDPTSRYQPQGVHGFSEVIDPCAYSWTDGDWAGRPWEETIIYELHVGTFTREGTFASAMAKLDHLVALGVTAIQIMPIAAFYGKFNWGYDGAMWFAPASNYGRPEDLKALVDAAHRRSLMVFLDVVYNHFGPQGNYLPAIAPIFSERHESPWGEALNFDGPDARVVRELVIESALYWMSEFNLDGLRFDAVQTMADDSPSHLLEVLAARLRASRPWRHTHLIIENSDNQEVWLRRDSDSRPVHYTAQWNDDVHHLLHAAATGENTGYYADFNDSEWRSNKLGRALAEGFAYQGEMKPHEGMKRGEPSSGLPATSFVVYMQNHDQIGNRIKGDRITRIAHDDAVKALTAIYLLSPQIPMLFQGEEWASEQPFPFFADAPAELRQDVRSGRQKSLKRTPEHANPGKPEVEEAVDPTSAKTFASARLDWSNLGSRPHSAWLQHYRSLIDLRKKEIVPRLSGQKGFAGRYQLLGTRSLLVSWEMGDGSTLRLYANLSDETQDGIPPIKGRRVFLQGFAEQGRLGPWSVLWTAEV
ncbi:MAG TPA: malto-oligosyltrehalose trehalohydrolase [Devosia sp.]|nr:malto-oligosyltrehalose trehalohydrolase [Devosia sp.]